MRILHRLAPGAPVQIRMHHLADDRAGSDDRHLDDDVVETCWFETRQRRHLRPRFNLEHAHRIGLAEHLKDERIVRQMRQIDTQVIILIHRISS